MVKQKAPAAPARREFVGQSGGRTVIDKDGKFVSQTRPTVSRERKGSGAAIHADKSNAPLSDDDAIAAPSDAREADHGN